MSQYAFTTLKWKISFFGFHLHATHHVYWHSSEDNRGTWMLSVCQVCSQKKTLHCQLTDSKIYVKPSRKSNWSALWITFSLFPSHFHTCQCAASCLSTLRSSLWGKKKKKLKQSWILRFSYCNYFFSVTCKEVEHLSLYILHYKYRCGPGRSPVFTHNRMKRAPVWVWGWVAC